MSEQLKPGRPPTLSPRDEFEIWQMREAGVKVKDCAAYLNVSVATTLRVLRKLRQKLGRIEKLPNARRARAYLTHRNTQA